MHARVAASGLRPEDEAARGSVVESDDVPGSGQRGAVRRGLLADSNCVVVVPLRQP